MEANPILNGSSVVNINNILQVAFCPKLQTRTVIREKMLKTNVYEWLIVKCWFQLTPGPLLHSFESSSRISTEDKLSPPTTMMLKRRLVALDRIRPQLEPNL